MAFPTKSFKVIWDFQAQVGAKYSNIMGAKYSNIINVSKHLIQSVQDEAKRKSLPMLSFSLQEIE